MRIQLYDTYMVIQTCYLTEDGRNALLDEGFRRYINVGEDHFEYGRCDLYHCIYRLVKRGFHITLGYTSKDTKITAELQEKQLIVKYELCNGDKIPLAVIDWSEDFRYKYLYSVMQRVGCYLI